MFPSFCVYRSFGRRPLHCHPMWMPRRDSSVLSLRARSEGDSVYTVILCECRGVFVRVLPEGSTANPQQFFSLYIVTLMQFVLRVRLPHTVILCGCEAYSSVYPLRARKSSLTFFTCSSLSSALLCRLLSHNFFIRGRLSYTVLLCGC